VESRIDYTLPQPLPDREGRILSIKNSPSPFKKKVGERF